MAQSYLVANLIVLILTLVVNLWTGVIILRKERTRIHMLIVFDCVANILSSVQTSFIQVRARIKNQTIPKTKKLPNKVSNLLAVSLESAWSADPLSGKQLLLLPAHGLEQVADIRYDISVHHTAPKASILEKIYQ